MVATSMDTGCVLFAQLLFVHLLDIYSCILSMEKNRSMDPLLSTRLFVHLHRLLAAYRRAYPTWLNAHRSSHVQRCAARSR